MRRVTFQCRCADTREGQHVVVVGGCAALGNWNPAAAVALGTTALEFPVWRSAKPDELPEKQAVEYKYVICGSDGTAVRWEETANRAINLQELADRGECEVGCSVVTVNETFNLVDEGVEGRFRSNGSVCGVRSLRSKSFTRVQETAEETDRKPAEDGEFSQTIRGRCPSKTVFQAMSSFSSSSVPVSGAGIGPTSHMSYSLLPPVDDLAASADVLDAELRAVASDVVESDVAGADVAHAGLAGMVREESSSNLFLNEGGDEEEAIEPMEFEDRYVLVGSGPLGEGTFGLVWRCRPKHENPEDTGMEPVEERTEMERAAKIVRKARLKPHEMRYLLGEGGEVLTHLAMKHPHIVELFEYFDEAHTVTLVLECCRGGDLFDSVVRQSRVSGRGLAEKAAAVATRHVLLALEHLHRHMIVHRDIKCENILLAKADTPIESNIFKLCDFGFAKHDPGDGLSDRLGSPDTVAPEVVVGSRYSCPADLWSAGVLLYMMLYARPPFYASSDGEVLKKVRAGNYSLTGNVWETISDPPKDLIRSLMTVDASKRPTASDALNGGWIQATS